MTKLLPLALAVLALLGCQQAAALQTTEVQQADSTMAAVLARLDRLESELLPGCEVGRQRKVAQAVEEGSGAHRP